MATIPSKSKVVIAVVGDKMHGKSTSICSLAKLIPLASKMQLHPLRGRFFFEVTIIGTYSKMYDGTEVRVGITSFGDNVSLLSQHFEPLITTHDCDIVVVACHNDSGKSGSTLDYVRDTARANSCKLILTSILRDDSIPLMTARKSSKLGYGKVCVNGAELSQVFAVNMINLINALA